jgi:hypothetical protein
MSIIRWLRLITLVLILFSCGNSLPTLDGVDIQEWKNDKKGCSGKRTTMLASIQGQTEKLLSLSEQEIISLLGKPDENELYTRNQKFYYYNVEPSPSCSPSATNNPKKLVVRFNAVGLAKEVAVE